VDDYEIICVAVDEQHHLFAVGSQEETNLFDLRSNEHVIRLDNQGSGSYTIILLALFIKLILRLIGKQQDHFHFVMKSSRLEA
jgi:hypothetical protein